jgi:hypothetical protein
MIFIKFNRKGLSYMPCATHNIHLVRKDGLKFNEDYNNLIEKVSKKF